MSYATTTQFSTAYNAAVIIDLCDDNKDGVADAGVIQMCLDWASRTMWSIIYPRYKLVTAMNPESYVSGAYPVLDSKCLTIAYARAQERQGAEINWEKHPDIEWCHDVRMGFAEVPPA